MKQGVYKLKTSVGEFAWFLHDCEVRKQIHGGRMSGVAGKRNECLKKGKSTHFAKFN